MKHGVLVQGHHPTVIIATDTSVYSSQAGGLQRDYL